MESTRTILPEEFRPFIDDFSRVHAGADVVVQVLDKQLGPTEIAVHQPLLGLSYNQEASRQLEVAVGTGTSQYIRHVVGYPKSMKLAVDDQMGDMALEIEPEFGPVTLVLLKRPLNA